MKATGKAWPDRVGIGAALLIILVALFLAVMASTWAGGGWSMDLKRMGRNGRLGAQGRCSRRSSDMGRCSDN